jgi:hypothetical protein
VAFLTKKKNKEIQIKDQYFIFDGRWFEKFADDKYIGCRQVEDTSQIPEEYFKAWENWKPKPVSNNTREMFGLSSYGGRSGKLF